MMAPKSALALPYAVANGHALAMVYLRPLDGRQELLLAEAVFDGALPARAATDLIAACACDAAGPIGAGRAAALSLGDREVILRALYALNYGRPVDVQLACWACSEAIELTLDLMALTAEPEADPGPVPTGADIEAAPDAETLALRFANLDEAALARADPNAECTLLLDCPACGHRFTAWLDAFALFAARAGAGGGILAQIDRLARAYGWSEADILCLPSARRARYCTMVGA